MKNKKTRFKKITDEEVRNAFAKQKSFETWNFYDEREFIENLLSQRFNYLLLVYSLFITAFAAIDGKENKLIILGTGIALNFLISLTIYRGYVKLDVNLKILHSLWDDHVFPIIRKETNARKFRLFDVNPFIGIYIPLLCIISLIIAFVLIYFNIWTIVTTPI